MARELGSLRQDARRLVEMSEDLAIPGIDLRGTGYPTTIAG